MVMAWLGALVFPSLYIYLVSSQTILKISSSEKTNFVEPLAASLRERSAVEILAQYFVFLRSEVADWQNFMVYEALQSFPNLTNL